MWVPPPPPGLAAEAKSTPAIPNKAPIAITVLASNAHRLVNPDFLVHSMVSFRVLSWQVEVDVASSLVVVRRKTYEARYRRRVERQGGFESGLYVIPDQMEIEPRSAGRAHFERIADGIYWYSFQP